MNVLSDLNFEDSLLELSENLYWDDDSEYVRQIETIRERAELFFKQLPAISSNPLRVKKCFKAYDDLSHRLAIKKQGDDCTKDARKSLELALGVLQPGINQLVIQHPLIAEQQMLQTPEIYYTCPQLIEERLSHLKKTDFLSRFGKELAWHATDHQLPSKLCQLHPHLVALEKEELEQLGALIHIKSDREEFAKKFGIDRIEELRESFLKNYKERSDLFDQGVCFGFSLSLCAQESPDPAALDWKKVKFLQMVSAISMNHSDELEKYQHFEGYERENPDYMKRYPLLTVFAAKEMGFQGVGNLDPLLLRKTIFNIISKKPKIDIDDPHLRMDVMKQRNDLRKEWKAQLQITDTLDYASRAMPPPLLKKMGLASLELVTREQSLDTPLIEILKDLPEDRFLFLLPDHALFVSLKDKTYCDSNDMHSITRQPRARRFATNEEMLTHLQRYLQIKYPEQTSFSLLQVKSLPSQQS